MDLRLTSRSGTDVATNSQGPHGLCMVSSPQGMIGVGLNSSGADSSLRYGVMHQSPVPLVLAAAKMVERTVFCDGNSQSSNSFENLT